MQEQRIKKGTTHILVTRFAQSTFAYKTISGISQTAPVQIICEDHGIPDGWIFAITGVKGGGVQLNSDVNGKIKKWYQATVIDTDTIEINSVNGADFAEYTSGGIVQYHPPKDLTDCTARMQVRETVDSPIVLFEYTDTIAIDEDGKVTTTLPADDTAEMPDTAYCDLEVVFDDDTVIATSVIKLILENEITR